LATGIEIARSLIGSGRPPGIAEALDFTLWQVEDGLAVCGGSIGVHALNPMGFVHGGYISTLLDTACGFALMSKLAEGQSYTTIDLTVSFLRGLTLESGEVRAEGRVVTIGRRVGFVQSSLLDGEDQLYASAFSSLLIIDPR
jgi:uncharacterized protein (TIGR00369 family)